MCMKLHSEFVGSNYHQLTRIQDAKHSFSIQQRIADKNIRLALAQSYWQGQENDAGRQETN